MCTQSKNTCYARFMKISKWKRMGRVRLSIDIPEELHQALKFAASRRNCTITMYVIRAIMYKLSLKER